MRTGILLTLLTALLAGCGGGSSGAAGRKKPPASTGLTVAYPAGAVTFRVGTSADAFTPSVDGGTPETFSIDPVLPAGLAFDTATGRISGSPTAASRSATYTVTANHPDGNATSVFDLSVTPDLPGAFISLAPGFGATAVATGLSAPVKMAFAPDGRLFVNELTTGNIRIVEADGSLAPDSFATVPVVTGAERGLIGLAVAPDFATSGHVFVFACVAASGGKSDRNQVIRFTAVGDLGTDPTVIVDDLPQAAIHNSGDIQFGPDGKLYVTVGDAGDHANAQLDGALAGRVLRYEADGTIPSDNPNSASPEWCRGLRNSFDLTVHPRTGGLFATENGPTFGDEVNFIQRHRNYEWQTLPPSFPGSRIGLRIIEWTPVIAPTGLTFHSGKGFGPDYADNLFVLGYVDADIRRLEMSGAALTDVDDELPFAEFENSGGVTNRPLDVIEAPDGALLVSTFTAIWKIERW